MVVVAMGLVSEARSKRVVGVMGNSKLPSCCEERDEDEAPSESSLKIGVPKALSATSFPACVTATVAAGKDRAAMALSSTENADAKTSSWLS